jgi:hypothetical protein
MTHRVIFKVPYSELGRSDVVFVVAKDGEKFGTLAVSKGSLVWFPRNTTFGRKVGWEDFDRFMEERPTRREKRGKGVRGRKPRRRRIAGALAPYFTSPRELRATYKGRKYTARVTATGRIKFRRKIYDSPTGAATAIVQSGRRNGWKFWRYRDAGGEWVPLENLR